MGKLAGTVTANANAVVDIKAACIPAVASAATAGVSDVTASVSAASSVVGSVK
jgi:hypothetical protein